MTININLTKHAKVEIKKANAVRDEMKNPYRKFIKIEALAAAVDLDFNFTVTRAPEGFKKDRRGDCAVRAVVNAAGVDYLDANSAIYGDNAEHFINCHHYYSQVADCAFVAVELDWEKNSGFIPKWAQDYTDEERNLCASLSERPTKLPSLFAIRDALV